MLKSDVIGSFFMQVLARKNLSCFYLDPAFYTKLSTTKETPASLFRWFKHFDPQSQQHIFIPIYHPGHWCLVVVDLRLCRFEYYDSLSKLLDSEAKKACEVRQSTA